MVFGFFESPPPSPSPPPPPPPTTLERVKSGVKKQYKDVRETIEYRREKRRMKKMFKHLEPPSTESISNECIDGNPASGHNSQRGSYVHDQYNTISANKLKSSSNEKFSLSRLNPWTSSLPAISISIKSNATSVTSTSSRRELPRNTTNRRKRGRPGNERACISEGDLDTACDREKPTGWRYLDTKRRTKSLGKRRIRRHSSSSSSDSSNRSDSDVNKGLYDERCTLRTARIHTAARPRELQRRIREREERRRRVKRVARNERALGSAWGCGIGVKHFFMRVSLSLCYLCAICGS